MRSPGSVDGLQDLGASGADEPGEADDLPGAEFEVECLELPFSGEALDAEDGFGGGCVGPLGEDVRDVPAGHEGDDLAGGGGRCGQSAGDGAAVLEDGDAVADAADLLQAVEM
ncbi:hypothetical protein STANM309S_04210 [Streptomyces tanashiensis]